MSNPQCGESFVVLQKHINNHHLFAFFPVLCKAWSCRKCRYVKSLTVRKYVERYFNTDHLYMLTFTMFRSSDAAVSWKDISAAWNRFRTYVVRHKGKFSYLRILEPHKKGGYPHMHVLVNRNIVDRHILKRLTSWGFGWNFQCEPVSSAGARKYVTKYLTKEWGNIDAEYLRKLTKARIVSASRDLPPIFYHASTWECLRYDVPNEHANFIHSVAITTLRVDGAQFVESVPMYGGFMIVSDRRFDISELDKVDMPYVWNFAEGNDFNYLWGVCQTELFGPVKVNFINR